MDLLLLNLTLNTIIGQRDSFLESIPIIQEKKGWLDEYDFIVIGGGSAGCTLASRLSENNDWNILLLEAGPPPNAFNEIPAKTFIGTDLDWQYNTVPQKHCCQAYDNRISSWPRGKVLGS